MIKYYNLVRPWSRWLFLMMFLFSLQSKALTQDSIQVSINAVNKPIEVVFKQIESQTGYTVFYGRPTLNGDELVTLQTRASLSSVMNTLLRGRGVSWALRDRSIILTRRVVGDNGMGNNIDTVPKVNITGSIVDKSGTPIVGATVSLRGQAMGQATDNLGKFHFIGIPKNAILMISSVGYRPRQIHLNDNTELAISLDSAITEIQKVEIVSNGYQVIAKERVTGSFVNIDNELFNRRVGATVLDRIKELVPGIYTTDGVSNNPLDDFTIRGVSTINANKRPLLVVDNFIFDGDPNSLNPNDVESITVLRDAAAASIWGVRAGNGVIVVTMKKGKQNSRPVVSLNSNVTFKQKPDLYTIPIVLSKDIVSMEKVRFDKGYYNQALLNKTTYPALSQAIELLEKKRAGVISPTEADAQLALLENYDVRNDVRRYLLQTAVAQQYSLNISGGSDAYQYYGSVGYDRDRPVDINIMNERMTLRFNSSWRPIKNLQIRAEINWGQIDNSNKNSLPGGYKQILTAPYNRIVDEKGEALPIPKNYRITYVDTVKFPGQLDWHYRPLDEAGNGDSRFRNYNTRINAGIGYTIIQGLKVEANYQWQKSLSDNRTINSLSTFSTRDLINKFANTSSNGLPNYPYPLGGQYSRNGSDQKAWSIRGQLTFDRAFDLHQISAIAGLETSEFVSETWAMPTQYGYQPQFGTFGLPQTGSWNVRPSQTTTTISITPASTNLQINRFGSYFANMAYTFNDKYVLSGSAKMDQSNFFGVKANDRKVPLWSAGLAWQIAQEGFYRIDWLPILRLRTTFGYNGNVNAGTSPLATVSYASPAVPILLPFVRVETPPNPQLRWERVRNINFALDFGSKEQRISGNIEFYRKNGMDLISQIDVDPTSGFTSYVGNESSLQTEGFDLTITTRNFDGLFKWYTTSIFAYQNDKVTAYTLKPSTFWRTTGAVIVGKPLSNIYSFPWAGLNAKDGDAQFYMKNQIVGSKSTTSAKQEDLVYSGQTRPPIFGAFRNDLDYKGFSLSLNVSYQFGHYFRRKSFDGSFGTATAPSLWRHEDYLNAWKMPGDEIVTNVPGFLDSYSDNRYELYSNSDILLEKGDHIRLQDIRFSYERQRKGNRSLVFSNYRIYIYMNNIGYIWKASKYDPDTGGGLTVRATRALALGINVGF